MRYRHCSAALVLFCLLLGGCSTAEEDLQGRWFNGEVSIRFRPDGTVLYNSRLTGLVEGVYEYHPHPVTQTSIEPVENLIVDFPGRQLRLDARFAGRTRLRLTEMPAEGQAANAIPSVALLKKADPRTDRGDGLDSRTPLATAGANAGN